MSNQKRDTNGRYTYSTGSGATNIPTAAHIPASSIPPPENPSPTTNYTHMNTIIKQAQHTPIPKKLTRTLPSVSHLGTLNTTDRTNWSLEGDGLSISANPNEWEHIAKLGGAPRWTITRTDEQPLTFLDAHNITPKLQQQIEQWGINNHLIEHVTAYQVTTYDSEWKQHMTSTYDTYDEALTETNEDNPDETIEEIQTIRFLNTPNKPRGADGINARDILTTLWTEQNTTLDGVWWNDNLNPDYLSAPRGVILPTRLTHMTHRPTQNEDYNDWTEYADTEN